MSYWLDYLSIRDMQMRSVKQFRPGGNSDVLDPYRFGIGLILKRMIWDFSPYSWINRRKLRGFKNLYYGEKAVIVCNGPSLRDIDFDQLKTVYTFGLNKINSFFPEISFRPDSIIATNEFVIDQNKSFYQETEIPLFLNQKARAYGIKQRSNVCFFHTSDVPYFARDVSFSVYEGYTVTYVALQFAFYMGFSHVALVGLDHDYNMKGEPNQINYGPSIDKGHFRDDYFGLQDLWQYPDLIGSQFYFDMARRCFEASGRTLVNVSTKSALEVLPKLSLKNFLEKRD